MIAPTIAPAAIMQLEGIYDYSFHRWGRTQADIYSDALLEMVDRIAARQVAWRQVSAEVGVDGYYCRCGSHFIYWRTLAENEVRIVAILHQHMHQLHRLRGAFIEDDQTHPSST